MVFEAPPQLSSQEINQKALQQFQDTTKTVVQEIDSVKTLNMSGYLASPGIGTLIGNIQDKNKQTVLPSTTQKINGWVVDGKTDSIDAYILKNFDGNANYKLTGFDEIPNGVFDKRFSIVVQDGSQFKSQKRREKNDLLTDFAGLYNQNIVSDDAAAFLIHLSHKRNGVNIPINEIRSFYYNNERVDFFLDGPNADKLRKEGILANLTHTPENGKPYEVKNHILWIPGKEGLLNRNASLKKSGVDLDDVLKSSADEKEKTGYISNKVNQLKAKISAYGTSNRAEGKRHGYALGEEDGRAAQKASTRLEAGLSGMYDLISKTFAPGVYMSWIHDSGIGIEATVNKSKRQSSSSFSEDFKLAAPNGNASYTTLNTTNAKEQIAVSGSLLGSVSDFLTLKAGLAYNWIKNNTTGKSETGITRNGMIIDKDITPFANDNSKKFYQLVVGGDLKFGNFTVAPSYRHGLGNNSNNSVVLDVGYNINSIGGKK